MKKNINQATLNALLEKKSVKANGKEYVNLVLSVRLNTGEVVTFEINQKFYNRKFDFKLKQNINEAK